MDEQKFIVTIQQEDGTKFDVEIEADKLLDIFKILFSDMKDKKQD